MILVDNGYVLDRGRENTRFTDEEGQKPHSNSEGRQVMIDFSLKTLGA